MKGLIIDETRWAEDEAGGTMGTGIYVRAKHGDKWESCDIALLTPESLLEWLRSRGGNNPYAENVVGVLLGWGNIADEQA